MSDPIDMEDMKETVPEHIVYKPITKEIHCPAGKTLKMFVNTLVKRLSVQLQLDVRYFLKGSVWLFIPTLVSYLLGLLRSVAFARLMEQEVYGQYGFILKVRLIEVLTRL